MAPTYKLHRIGLGPVRRWATVRADDASPEAAATLVRVLTAASPEGRLKAIKERAIPHAELADLADEIAWVDARLKASNGSAELDDLHALTALERLLDLLHTQQHLQAVIEHQRRREKDQKRGARMARLPPADKLRLEIAQMRKTGHGSERECKGKIAERYEVTVAAVTKRLRTLKKTD
ncbi:MAG: hypothetical protein KGL50_06060 [Burkholderiales bacterium]|nr:hypothetical protein [Burkholderiales bacterium]